VSSPSPWTGQKTATNKTTGIAASTTAVRRPDETKNSSTSTTTPTIQNS
jgi:hypothetical protein